jgi:hypothetical protein
MTECSLCGRGIYEEYFDLNDNQIKVIEEDPVEEGTLVYCMKCVGELGRKPETTEGWLKNGWLKKLFGGGKNE